MYFGARILGGVGFGVGALFVPAYVFGPGNFTVVGLGAFLIDLVFGALNCLGIALYSYLFHRCQIWIQPHQMRHLRY